MRLTEQDLARFIGGQVLEEAEGRFSVRGQCSAINIKGDILWIAHSWTARCNDVFEGQERWELHETDVNDYGLINLRRVENKHTQGHPNRLSLEYDMPQSTITFFPPDDPDNLDRASVVDVED